MKRNIVIITDCKDIAYNELRGVVLSSLKEPDNFSIEPLVTVVNFSVQNGSFVTRLMAESYPPGTIFSIILNPMQDRPERIYGRTKEKDFTFIGANTGVFGWLFEDFGIKELYELNDPGFFPFGGKYVHAPMAAKLAESKDISIFGKIFDQEKLRNFKHLDGSVVHIDNFGLIKFFSELEDYADGELVSVFVNGVKVLDAVYSKRMMSLPTGTWVVYPGSSLGLPELGKVRMNGSESLDIKVGDIITLKKA